MDNFIVPLSRNMAETGLQVLFRKELLEQCGAGLQVRMLTSVAFRTKPLPNKEEVRYGRDH
jgi:hypothetical protein